MTLRADREAGEVVPDQERHRLAEIERGLAGRAEEVAGIEARHRDLRRGEVGGEHHPVGPQLGRQQSRSMPSKTWVASVVLTSSACAVSRRPAGHVARRGNRRRRSWRRETLAKPSIRCLAMPGADFARPGRRSAARRHFPRRPGQGIVRPDGDRDAANRGHPEQRAPVDSAPRRLSQCPDSPSGTACIMTNSFVILKIA